MFLSLVRSCYMAGAAAIPSWVLRGLAVFRAASGLRASENATATAAMDMGLSSKIYWISVGTLRGSMHRYTKHWKIPQTKYGVLVES